MPPSPAIGRSPGRDLRAEIHKRGRSLENGLFLREKDDDLALFKEMQNREKDNFLIHSPDDLDESLSTKLRYFSDFKLGISIPGRGEGSNLLDAGGDKNDYDWLLTPPDTPLFPSLDDETPPINLSHSGRPQSQPISIPRSATAERSYRNSRSSASPHRSSPSPRSEYGGTYQSRGRSPAPHSSKTPVVNPSTPSRSPSTPPNRPLTSAPRSSTPTPRRTNVGSSGTANLSGRRGTSPVKASRGNSSSPKLQAWQSNISGFSSEAPPNLRTSLSDRPASYVRGSSPASRNGRGLSPSSSNGRGLSPSSSNGRGLSPASSNERGLSPTPRNGRASYSKRQSMSPTASRSTTSSSYGHDRDHFSSQSKGSVASSGDDDIDSLQSVRMSISENSATRKVGPVPNSRPLAFSKKPSRIVSSTSAPKRSFDSAIRQMDRRSPQNMFRPLLSSVPSTTFYVGKASSANRSMISRNSSVTTSSNASSEQGASIAPDTEGSDHDQDHMATQWRKVPHPDVQDEVFFFDKVDGINENAGSGSYDGKVSGNVEGITSIIESGDSQNPTSDNTSEVVALHPTCVEGVKEVDCNENTATCSECGRKYGVTAPMEGNDGFCPDCGEKGKFLPFFTCENSETCSKCGRKFDVMTSMERNSALCSGCCEEGRCLHLSTPETSVVVNESTLIHTEMSSEGTKSSDALVHEKGLPEFPDSTGERGSMLIPDPDEKNLEQAQSCLCNSSSLRLMVGDGEQHLVNQQVAAPPNQSPCNPPDQQVHHFKSSQSLKVDVSEGAGISVLLKRSSSSKWPVVQARAFTAGNIPFDDLSYARDGMTSMRSSIGHGSGSASSSVDWNSSRQTEARFQRQLSCAKFDPENSRHDSDVKHQSHGMSSSGIVNQVYVAPVLDMSKSEENLTLSVGPVGFKAIDETLAETKNSVRSAELDDSDSSIVRADTLEGDKLDCGESCRTMDASATVLSCCTVSVPIGDNSEAVFPNEDNYVSSGNTEFPNDARSILEGEVRPMNQRSLSIEEEAAIEDSTHSSVMISGETEADQECSIPTESTVLSNSKGIVDEFHDHSTSTTSEKDLPVFAAESCVSDYAHGILEESTVMVGGLGKRYSRSLTLDEATDTILFCSSIIHDLAYQAATTAMQKENLVPLEELRPNSNWKELRSISRNNKRTPKPQKIRRRRVEADAKTASPKTDPNIKSNGASPDDSRAPNKVDSMKPPKLESKCNCIVM